MIIINKDKDNYKWKCYLFGAANKEDEICLNPSYDMVPNFFIRWMMKICLGCTWERTITRK